MSNLPFWVLGAACVVALIAFLRGRASVKAEQAAKAQEAKDIADEIENDIGLIPPDRRREELRKWSK